MTLAGRFKRSSDHDPVGNCGAGFRMNEFVYDAAVLVAADRNQRRTWAEHKARLEFGSMPLVPAPVAAQVSRFRGSKVRMCWLGLFVFVLTASVSGAQEPTGEWYPHQPGTSWVYQNEALEGDMRHPDFERWTTEETVVSAVNDPALGGIVVTKRITVTSDTLSAKYNPANDYAKKERSEQRELIRQNCAYPLDGVFGNAVAAGRVPADSAFPWAGQNVGQNCEYVPG